MRFTGVQGKLPLRFLEEDERLTLELKGFVNVPKRFFQNDGRNDEQRNEKNAGP